MCIIWVFLFITGLFPDKVYAKQVAENKEQGFFNIPESENSNVFSHHTNTPPETSLIPESSDQTDDNKETYGFDGDCDNENPASSFPNFPFENSLSLIPKQCVRNRITVSLFILYHSWKSFPY